MLALGLTASWPMLVVPIVSAVAVSLILLLCIKLKSSKKDPAFVGLEGTISPIKEGRAKEETDGQNGHDKILLAPAPVATVPRPKGTPSRTGERRLPEIPPATLRGPDDGSDLYATLEGSDEDEEDGGGRRRRRLDDEDDEDEDEDDMERDSSQRLLKDRKDSHPYAKVKKKGAVEHPYATVKKPAASPGAVEAAARRAGDEDNGRLLRPTVSSSMGSNGDLERRSRTGSGRSGNLAVAEGGDVSLTGPSTSRQTTPLPPEPASDVNDVVVGPAGYPSMMQNPNHHFSGDSQDSSKGYTRLTVREAARHILLQRPAQQDATYATVSETSDDMYAAIEDPTYARTGGASQSNSDTYAIIDLPEESEVDFNPEAATAARRANREPAMAPLARAEEANDLSPDHPYSQVMKPKRSSAGVRSGPPSREPGVSSRAAPAPRAPHVEEMYAKVNKRGGVDDDLDLPVGASAMHPRPEDFGGARPRAAARTRKSEVNYSDFEVSLVDKEVLGAGGHVGYETVREDGRRGPWGDKGSGYETVPEKIVREDDEEEAGFGYERVPDYWRTGSSGGGYETVKEGKDPNYEVLKNNNYHSLKRNESGRSGQSGSGYATVAERRLQREHPYDVLRRQSEPGEEDEAGYETINRRAVVRAGPEEEPNYEQLAKQSSEPGYETVREEPGRWQREQGEQRRDAPALAYENLPPAEDDLRSQSTLVASESASPTVLRLGAEDEADGVSSSLVLLDASDVDVHSRTPSPNGRRIFV